MKSLLRLVLAVVLALVLMAVTLAALLLAAAAPRPDEWRVDLALGRWHREASVPTLLRWATHPLALPRLDGLALGPRDARWQLHARAHGALEASCAPCRFHVAALGDAPIVVAQAALLLHPRGADRYDGELRLGPPAQAVVLPWRAELRPEGLLVHAELAATPVARVVALFGDAVPEARRARIAGSVSLSLEATLGADGLQLRRIVPRFAELEVDGLGTEALLDVDAGARCRPQPAGGRIEGWIQNAVIAAEDQHFFEHPGFELEAWVAVSHGNQQQASAPQGASTITQQLAKLLYTGDERDAMRKLREWLYAVEMERTLGKGRILQLYLAVLPWGDGICGAEAAARHHLGKPASQLRPREAAWLASLLINPDLQLRRWAQDEETARARVAWVVKGMRRLPRERREAELEALAHWQPPIARPLLVAAPPRLTSAAP